MLKLRERTQIEAMKQIAVTSIVIVGGGTAGWMTAMALARTLGTQSCSIRVIESEGSGSASIDETTIPAIRDFNRRLGIDEQEFMRATGATFKLGIEFADWRSIGASYMHPSGPFGLDINGVGFHHYWLKQRIAGNTAPFDQFALASVAASKGRFKHPAEDRRSVNFSYSYAVNLDASLYVEYLRGIAEKLGVQSIDGMVVDVHLRAKDGFVDSIVLESGESISGELFIDCSGSRGLLIEGALKTGYEDWRAWLPCDSALVVQTESTGDPMPYTRATAGYAGWQWQIPLQNRVSNGHVYSSAYIGEDVAASALLSNVEGQRLTEPQLTRFTPGKRLKMWNRNCVAIGSSAGFIDPLEPTGIFLIQAAIIKLIEFFPNADFAVADTCAYNRQLDKLFDDARDFVVLHYKATQRDDSSFWDYCREMSVPDELAQRLMLFASRGVALQRRDEPFVQASWLSVFLGQGVIPEAYDPRTDCIKDSEIAEYVTNIHQQINAAAEAMPPYSETVSQYCNPSASA